jgi:4-amino-4-deoxy-L-arabinose transferase-like glycosyltransferase
LERVTAPTILLLMIGLQAIWVLGVWLVGGIATAPAWILLIVTIGLGAGALWLPVPAALSTFSERVIGNPPLARMILFVVFGAAVCYGIYQDQLPDEPQMLIASRVVALQGVGPFLENYQSFGRLGGLHPPLMPLAFGFVMDVVGDNPSLLRPIPAALLVFTLVIVYELGQELYDRTTGVLAAILFLAPPYTFRYGTALLGDVGVMFCSALAVLLIVRLTKLPSLRLAIAAGATIGVGVLTKYTMVLICPVILLWPVVAGRVRRTLPLLGVVAVVALAVILPWLTYSYFSGLLATQSQRVFNFSRVITSGPEGRAYMSGLVMKNLPSGIGVYNFPLIALGLWTAMRDRQPSDRFLLCWVVLVWVALLVTLPDPRYFMITFPALAILMARALGTFPDAAPRIGVLALSYGAIALSTYTAARRFVP